MTVVAPQTDLDLESILCDKLELKPKEVERYFDFEEQDGKLILKVHRDGRGKPVWVDRTTWNVVNNYVKELSGAWVPRERLWEIPLGTDSEAPYKEARNEIPTPTQAPIPIEQKQTEKPNPSLQMVPLDALVESPFQYRTKYNEKRISELADSIKAYGIIEPLIVRKNGIGALELIAGHRRLRAAKKASLTKVPIILKVISDEDAIFLQIIENLQSEGVSDYDTGKKLFQLSKSYSQKETSKKIGVSDRYIRYLMSHYQFCEKTLGTVVPNVDFYDLKERQTRELRTYESEKVKKHLGRLALSSNAKITKQILKQLHKSILRENLEIYEKEIREFLKDNPYLTTFLSYPKRGSFGDSDFRGNTSGFLLVQLIHHFQPKTVYDPMEGSGTTRDVCNIIGVEYLTHDGYERNDILQGFDLLNAENEIPPNDLTFFHPPYWDIIKYSDNPYDLSRADTWEEYTKRLEICINKLLPKTKVLAVLIADIYKGSDQKYHSPLPLLLRNYQDHLFRILVKAQEHFSRGAEATKPVIPIFHEYVLLLRGDLSG